MLLKVNSEEAGQFIDITAKVSEAVTESGVKNGLCHVFVPHTTAAVTINENADPNVEYDIIQTLNRLVPNDPAYRHLEGNSDAHVKSTLVGASEVIAIENFKLALGTWQAIYFCEFDGPRTRKVWVNIISES
ncbi:MAG: secondary thiamine-phosphate synthase enzyme YjbQ [Thermodesulfobacteriota bacterium]